MTTLMPLGKYDQEELEFWFPPENGLESLEGLNREEAGLEDGEVCERCEKYHPSLEKAPVRTMYASGEQPQPVMCSMCMEEWNEYWDDMWADYHRRLL